MTELTKDTFWPFVRSVPLAVVHFWAPWNKVNDEQIDSVLESLASDYGEQISFARLNVDEASGIAEELKIRNLPAIGYFRHGSGPVEVGVRSRDWIAQQIQGIVS
jgi:thioredoxin-like negative regulator of GroEL